MAKFWLCAAVGLYLLQLCSAQIGLNISCRYAGVFHVEKNHRYSLTREDAIALCKALNSTIPTLEQMRKAYNLGFETCRYGYIEDKVVVPRHTPYHLCAANTTGIYILSTNGSERYDTYCFNSSETRDKVCDPVIKLYSVWPNNGSTIEIFNADGSRYIEGQKFTERPSVTDDEITAGSGSANDRPTTDSSFIRHGITHYADRVTPPYHAGAGDEVEDHLKDQHTQHPTVEVSNNRKHHENSTEGQHIPQEFPLWWPPEENERRQTTTFGYDESSEENDDDGGGDDDDDDDDDSEEGSGHINPERVIEWDNSGDQELQPSNTNIITTAVSPSNDFFKQEESNGLSQDGNHSGLETKDTVLTTTNSSHILHPGLVPSKERESTLENESFHHTVIFFNESAQHGESHQDHLQPVDTSGQRNKISSATNRTISGVLEILLPPDESDDENASSQTADVVSNNGIKHEESTERSLSHGVHSEWTTEEIYLTDTSIKAILPEILHHPSENEHNNESVYTVVDATDDTNHEDSSNNTLIHGIHSSWSPEDRFPANTSGDDVLPDIISPNESTIEGNSETSHTAIVPSDSAPYEDSAHETILHKEHSEWKSEEKYLTNTSGIHFGPGIVHPTESERGKEPSLTAVASSDNGKHEDSTEDPLLHGMPPGWESKSDLPMNTTRDHVPPEIIPSNEMIHENEISHTVLDSNGGEEYEDSMQDSSTDKTHTGWTSEPRHSANQSKDYWVPGIILPTENVHGKETPHKDSTQPPIHHPGSETEEVYPISISRDGVLVGIYSESENHQLSTDVVYDGTKEDTTLEPVRQWVSEDKYTTKSPADVIIPGIVPRGGINQKNKTEHTAVAATDGSKKGEPTEVPSLHEMNPGQSNRGEHLLNNTQEYMIPGVFSEVDSGSDRQPSNSDSSSPGGHGRGVSHSGNVTPLPGESPNSQKRRAIIPDWLIVVASLLALALILGVCIAVNSRRRCGQKKKLMINNGKGGINEKNTGGLNGEASKSQEMVNLVQKEKLDDQTGPRDEFLAIDETQNQQAVALKSGV
ncbi:CD44 antigen isoform X6 [Anolis carolinensis]|uniref:CD44 antigen isoform X6 n=1 Tax=Anolis carolinensis TaxID=28377 RepID=UPI002F2B229E